jgi:hypothetical protein
LVVRILGWWSVNSGNGTDLCGVVAHASRINFGREEDLFAWDARSTDSIGARLLIAVRPGRVDVAVSGAEGVEGDGFGDICGPIEIDSGMYV